MDGHKLKRNQQDITEPSVENGLILHHSNEEDNLETDLSKLERCIEKLNTEQKKCVQLFYLEKRTYIEIKEITNYELKKVKSYIQNGKRNLKLCMSN